MKRTNLFKAMATILAVAMVLAMVPMAVMAANTATADIEYDYAANKAVVKGSIDSGAELTMIVVRTTEEITSLDYFTSDTDLENAIMYIDQITSDGTEKTWTFELRDTAAGNVLTAFVGGTDAAVDDDMVKILTAAPTISIAADTAVFSDEDIVFTVENGSAEWAAAATVEVNGEADDTAVVTADSITLTGKTANVTSITVKNADYQDAKWTGTVTVKDRYTEAKKAVKSATIEYVEDSDKAIITVPADETDAATGADIAYTVTVGGEAKTVTDGKVEVTRNADNGDEVNDAVVVIITATITKDGSALGDAVTQTINVNEMGTDGYTIVAEDIALTDVAYGIADAKVATVKIANTEIDATAQVVKVNGTALYYAPERSTGNNHVYVGIIRTNNADAAAVAAVAEIADEVPVSIYYGKVGNPTDGTTSVIGTDAAAAKRMNKNSAGYSDAEYLVFDIYGTGKVEGTTTACIVRANKKETDKKAEFSIISDN